ncbi:MAG: acetylxylan esterase [Candidatus Sumerlaea chitinivorans]|nr:acetylxylan esterase [Candidatus Sumerlaea chitinivorans]
MRRSLRRVFSFAKHLSAGLVVFMVLGNQTDQANAAWRFEVLPNVEKGKPAVRAVNDSKHEGLYVRVTKLSDTTAVLESGQFAPASEITYELPSPKEPTHVEVTFTTAPNTQPPLFVWRTVAMPKGVPPIHYRGARGFERPADFDEFWMRAKKQLATVPMEPVIERVPDRDTSTGLLYKVTLRSVGDTKIVCWYFVPRDALDDQGQARRRCPAVIIMPGYGAEEPPIDRTTSGIATLSVNPRNHGPSRDYWKCPVEHLVWNIADPENFYYRLAFLDCLRAAEFLFERPEIDPKRVAAEGGSQGGLFALALAALEPRIACVCSNVTAFSAYADGIILGTLGHHKTYREILGRNDTTATLVRKSLAYTDGANMATRVRCPVQISMAGIDPVCNYMQGIVVYNRIPKGVPKEYHVAPNVPHAVPPEMREWNARWYRRWLGVK